MTKKILQKRSPDGLDRRGFLECMAWAGSGVIWTAAGGALQSQTFGQNPTSAGGEFHFVQISDSHVGFNKPANADVNATLQIAIDKINALPRQPDFIIHTGDLSHTSKAAEFDTLDQLLKGARQQQVFFVPGEHDTSIDDGKLYLERYGRDTKGRGWYSFTHKDVHFVGLNNVAAIEGLGKLGADQIQWLQADLKGQPSSRPIVVFAHIPLWSVYPDWGWGTEDSAQALAILKRFGSVTVLNGHIHQVMQKVEGAVSFYTANSTAFPQPAPGVAKGPGPLKVPDEKLRSVLGIREVHAIPRSGSLAVVDSTLADDGKALFEKRCGGCHALDRDKEGPKLHGVSGRAAGKSDSFEYSEALKKSDVKWTDEMLEKWLADPDSVAPGNNMAFHVDKAEERRAIIEYLKRH